MSIYIYIYTSAWSGLASLGLALPDQAWLGQARPGMVWPIASLGLSWPDQTLSGLASPWRASVQTYCHIYTYIDLIELLGAGALEKLALLHGMPWGLGRFQTGAVHEPAVLADP